MKKLFPLIVALALAIAPVSASAQDANTYQNLGIPLLSSNRLTVTLNSANLIEDSGSMRLEINYTETNNTANEKIDEATFKLFFTDGTSEPQYGFFNPLFPGDTKARSYTWRWLKNKEPWLVELDSGFFSKEPSSSGFKWKIGNAVPQDSAVLPIAPIAQGFLKINAPAFSLAGRAVNFSVTLKDAAGSPITAAYIKVTNVGSGFLKNEEIMTDIYGVAVGALLIGSDDFGTSEITATYGQNSASAKIAIEDLDAYLTPVKIAESHVEMTWVGQKLQLMVNQTSMQKDYIRVSIDNRLVGSKTTISDPAELSFANVTPGETMLITTINWKQTVLVPVKFSSCETLWNTYTGGISKAKSVKNKGVKTKKVSTVFPLGYSKNQQLDKDRDGLVCER